MYMFFQLTEGIQTTAAHLLEMDSTGEEDDIYGGFNDFSAALDTEVTHQEIILLPLFHAGFDPYE